MANRKKIYAYVDESGQDPASGFFVVSVLLTSAERDILQKELERIERTSKKGLAKWRKAHHTRREVYIAEIAKLDILKGKIYFKTYKKERSYFELDADATASALRAQQSKFDKAVVFVDGLTINETQIFKRYLRPSVKMRVIVQVMRRDESSPFIRLVDAICGLVRDAKENRSDWTVKTLASLKRKEIVTRL
jgi:hypothetical protein